MNFHQWRVAALGASLLGLCACSKPADPAVSIARPTDLVAVARGGVDVEGGLAAIVASRDGTVSAVDVKENDKVVEGQVLVQLDPRQADLAVAAAQAEVDQSVAQAGVLAARLQPLERQSGRLASAASDGAATGQSADDARAAVTELKAELEAAKASTNLARQHVAAAQFERGQLTLRAPYAGRVVARAVQVGDRVAAQSGKELLRILPDRPLIVRAQLGEAFVDTVRPDMRAEVIADADPGKVLAGHVVRVGQVFGVAGPSDDPKQSPDARVVDCVIALDGGALRIGQQVLVRIRRK